MLQALKSFKIHNYLSISLNSEQSFNIFIEDRNSEFFIYDIHYVAHFAVPRPMPPGTKHHSHNRSAASANPLNLWNFVMK